jgi:predicted DCC family thiol-disulfide oxidoreductase YuxK
MIGTLINTFWESTIENGRSFLSANSDEKVKRAKLLIGVFYLFVFVNAVQTFSPYQEFTAWSVLLESQQLFTPIWTMRWFPTDHWELGVRSILLFFLGSSLLGLLFWQRSRIIRVAVFVAIFLYLSFVASFGKIDHFMHVMLLSSFLFIFLPNQTESASSKLELLKVFFGAQTLVLLAYFVSGFFKLYGILDQEVRGVVSALSPDSLARNLAKSSLASSYDTFFSSVILYNNSYVFSAFMIVGFAVEFLAIYVVFKPKLHRIWGVILMLLHAGIVLTVGPDFTIQMFVVGILLVFSPFANLETDIVSDVSGAMKSLKNRLTKSKNEFVLFYDGDCLMCNGFITFLAKYDLPDGLKISKIQSDRFQHILSQNPDLAAIDSIIVVETKPTGEQLIRIKSDCITWVLTKVTSTFVPLRLLHLVSPYTANTVYDLIAKNRDIPGAEHCPMPPENIRKRLVS